MKTSLNRSSKRLLHDRLLSEWNDQTVYNSELIDIIQAACIDADSALSMRVWYCLLTHDYDRLLAISCSPHDYSSQKDYYLDNFIVGLVKKYPHWDTSIDPTVEAKKTFISCEIQCKQANDKFLHPRSIDTSLVPSVLHRSRRKVMQILGTDLPAISSLPVVFGPGRTFSVKGRTTTYDKLNGALDVTPEAAEEAILLLQSCPGWLSLHGIDPMDVDRIRDCLTIIPGDSLSFVLKTAKTDRPIGIGPGLNVLLQKAHGAVIRNKLKRFGLHLNRCPEKHVELARRASLDGSLATVDLVSASNLIGREYVANQLPWQWYDRLDSLRSHRYTIDGKWYDYQMFSAMGNGYTFELESLLFYATALAVCEELGLPTEDVSVFGDDIILPTEGYDLLMQTLTSCGFTINQEKSFHSGPFRESCGGDFYDGIASRAFSVKDHLDLRTIVRLRNHLYRTGYRFWFRKLWRKLRQYIKPYESLLAGPDDNTDDHIIFDGIDPSRKFNAVTVSSNRRKVPRQWHKRRVWMLYEATSIKSYAETHYQRLSNVSPSLSEARSCRVGLSLRDVRKLDLMVPFWNQETN